MAAYPVVSLKRLADVAPCWIWTGDRPPRADIVSNIGSGEKPCLSVITTLAKCAGQGALK